MPDVREKANEEFSPISRRSKNHFVLSLHSIRIEQCVLIEFVLIIHLNYEQFFSKIPSILIGKFWLTRSKNFLLKIDGLLEKENL
jgi:hypothetical protein